MNQKTRAKSPQKRTPVLPGISLRLLLGLAAAGGLAYAIRLWVVPISCWDLWYHMRAADLIQRHWLPAGEVFSWTAAGKPWMINAWLGEILFRQLYQHAGPAGTILAQTLLSIAVFVALAWTTIRIGGRPTLAMLSAFLALAAGYSRFMLRPELFSLVLAAATLIILYEYKHGQADRLPWLIPIGLLWPNLHMGFTAGVAILGCFLAGEGLAAWSLMRRAKPISEGIITGPRLRRLAWFTLGMMAATLINPYGPKAWLFMRLISGQFGYVAEWQPLWEVATLTRWVPLACLGLLAALAFGFLALSRRAKDLSGLLLTVLFAAMALKYNRQAAQFCLVAPLVIASAARGLQSPALDRAPRLGAVGLLVVEAVVFVAFAAWGIPQDAAQQPMGTGINKLRFSQGAVRFIRKSGLIYPGSKLFNSLESGGWLIWNLWPNQRVYFDGRVDVYGYSAHMAYVRTALSPEIGRRLEESGIDYCYFQSPEGDDTVSSQAVYHLAQDPGWAVVYFDDGAIVIARREPRYLRLIDRYEYRFANPVTVTDVRPDDLFRNTRRALDEIERTQSECPDSVMANLAAGILLQKLGRSEEAISRLERARRLVPKWQPGVKAQADSYLGRAWMARERYSQAAKSLREAVESAPEMLDARILLAECEALSGNRDEALRQIELAMKQDPGMTSGALSNPAFAGLRDDPRFRALSER